MPPLELVRRVTRKSEPEPLRVFDWYGREHRHLLSELLPATWTWEGKRVLDFGCGPGALLRYLINEAQEATIYGCDIHEPSIAWVEQHLSPPFQVFANELTPPLPLPDAALDLIVALEVFPHLVDYWSAWLLELDRVLAPSGLIVATIAGQTVAATKGYGWDERRVGMNVQGYVVRAPMVFHSRWWLERHWGRAFRVQVLPFECPCGRQLVLLRKRDHKCTAADLEYPDFLDPREGMAMFEQLAQLRQELGDVGPARSSGG